MSRVLLLGSTGAVGSACLDILLRDDDLDIVIAGRDEARLRSVCSAAGSEVEVARLDVADADALAAAAVRCDILVNCAGPSHRVSPVVVDAAAAAGVAYVDPGGDQAVLDRLVTAQLPMPAVLQAGVQPGLSGLVLRLLALRRSAKITDFAAWCGGLQPLTKGSVSEYTASLYSPYSHPASALRHGKVRRVRSGECKQPPAPYFPASATAHPHLDAETVGVAAHLGVDNVEWINVLDGQRIKHAMQQLAAEDPDRAGRDPDAALAASKLDLFGREPYFTIVATAHGDSEFTTLAVTCRDSYRVTGALTAYGARYVATMPAGVTPFWAIEDPWQAIEFLSRSVPEFAVLPDSDVVGQIVADPATVEEGAL